ncbi:Sensitivity To Red Light Reduced-like SRR1 [Pyrenophora seminiperda CCB06]|uniref:Sensitivity To Red Light Reduced-like SRR1 n=1 Tax=Pyrenophora seminiperda CCB06 TaxID=1302712 RepID=A0A3M7LVX0_9PLEO|nr:Sensitivity To Red Light Reduced-like SRR1 [Pyrenophora seminiperda CCB06]
MGKGRVKRQQVATDDGWTVITHGLSNVSLNEKEKDSKSKSKSIVSGLTSEKLLSEFQLLQERWEDTLLAQQIDEIFCKGRRDDVQQAVCIGIGSFSRDWAHRWRSLWQLVLFVDVVAKSASNEQATSIPCYASDPAFTPLDTSFLSLLHITTLPSSPSSSPDLASKISPTTFVYSPFVDWFLLLPTFLKDKDPRVYVGNEILSDYSVFAQTKEKREMLGVCNEVGRRWLEGRRVVRLREFERHGNALGGLVVYLREGGVGEEEGAGEVKEEEEEEEKSN